MWYNISVGSDNMDFDLRFINNELTILCSKGLENFSKEFIDFYNERIDDIKKKLMINADPKIIVALTDDVKYANFTYGYSDFSGFFTDTGAFAYINLNGEKDKIYMFNGLLHELTHYFYLNYVYGKDKKRIVWVDEGIAQFLSGQKNQLLNNDKYYQFLKENLNFEGSINLNELRHSDKSFGNKNGYNLSYIAIRYLYETNNQQTFINIIKDYDLLIKTGEVIIDEVKDYFNEKYKTSNIK